MNRLWVRLSFAFVFVTLVGVVSTSALVNRQVATSFLHFVARSHVLGLWEEPGTAPLLAVLAEHYEEVGDWSGVESVLAAASPGSGRRGSGRGPAFGGGASGAGFALADQQGVVVYDAIGGEVGRELTRSERAMALPIEGEDGVIGYLVTGVPRRSDLSEAARGFLAQLNRALIIAGVLAALVGVGVGVVLARGLAAPLDRLAQAAREIHRGDLTQQVPVEGADEVAELSRAFNEMASGLLEAEEQRRNMVADVAHELRTPLSVMQGNLRAVLDGVYPLARDEIEVIYDESVVLGRLVEDLYELANAEAGQLQLRRFVAPIDSVIDRSVAGAREEAERRGIDLSAEVDDDLPEVDIDADRISQVLRNLLTNAMRHTPEGGSVTITARLVGAGDPGVGSRAYGPTDDAGAGVADGTTYAAPDDAGHGLADGALDDAAHGANQGVADRATDSAAASRRFVRVAVTDTGEGIAPEDLSRVFDRFWRAEKSRSRDHGGSGLGLAIAMQLIEAHGGAIGAMSVEGGGAELWFTVPVADATE